MGGRRLSFILPRMHIRQHVLLESQMPPIIDQYLTFKYAPACPWTRSLLTALPGSRILLSYFPSPIGSRRRTRISVYLHKSTELWAFTCDALYSHRHSRYNHSWAHICLCSKRQRVGHSRHTRIPLGPKPAQKFKCTVYWGLWDEWKSRRDV